MNFDKFIEASLFDLQKTHHPLARPHLRLLLARPKTKEGKEWEPRKKCEHYIYTIFFQICFHKLYG